MQIDAALVETLVEHQFPQWSSLAISPVPRGGNDNRTFRLGTELLARLPSAQGYAAQVEKEQQWLGFLAKHLSTTIPTPVAIGQPAQGFPWSWSVYKWINAADAEPTVNCDPTTLAPSIAQFLIELHRVNASGGPPPGKHNYYRGGDLHHYDKDTRNYCVQLQNVIDSNAALNIWCNALSTPWTDKPVWIHGDLEVSNVLVANNALAAVIDFGLCAVGDPACDFVMAWTLFDKNERELFRQQLKPDDATWERGKAWALWKALFRLSTAHDAKADASADYTKAMQIVNRVITND